MPRTTSSHMMRAPRRQQGAALIVALIFLLLLTILAVSASSTSLMQARMVSATRNAQLADWGAQSALSGAEWRLWTASSSPATRLRCGSAPALVDCYVNDPMYPNTVVQNFRSESGWHQKYETGSAYTTYDTLDYSGLQADDANAKLAASPVYIIEDLGIERPPGITSPMHESGVSGTGGVGYRSIERHLYRITARSPGANTNTVHVMQSIFAAKSN